MQVDPTDQTDPTEQTPPCSCLAGAAQIGRLSVTRWASGDVMGLGGCVFSEHLGRHFSHVAAALLGLRPSKNQFCQPLGKYAIRPVLETL